MIWVCNTGVKLPQYILDLSTRDPIKSLAADIVAFHILFFQCYHLELMQIYPLAIPDSFANSKNTQCIKGYLDGKFALIQEDIIDRKKVYNK